MRSRSRTDALQTADALGLDCVTFEAAAGVAPSGKPPVRIFLGTEEAQSRAERVFLYSVREFRDPARVYRIYLLKDLPGFDRRGWRTGFTQYRFAIPELAGGEGRAIYNDVDQIYLADPALLFDLDLQGCGYRAVSANDTSVMLLDCARMLRWWNLQAAQAGDKRELVEGPAAEAGLLAPLSGEWNARDFEYRPGESKLLHYTTLHLQPWRPTPEQYSYHPHPLGRLWHDLEREADAQRYHPFTRERPSANYRKLAAEQRAPLLPTAPAETVAVTDHLEMLSAQDVAWFLEGLFGLALRVVHIHVNVDQATRTDDRASPTRLAAASEWWRDRIAEAAERRPSVAWELEVVERGRVHRYEYRPQPGPPRVWALLGRHEGDNRQVLALADALGWPYETRMLAFRPRHVFPTWLRGASRFGLDRAHSDALGPPWPDFVLACGRRSAPVARWIRRRSGGAARLVQLGRPQAPLKAFDLIVTTPQYGLPGRSNVLHNVLPLNRPLAQRNDAAAAAWLPRLASLPRPWIALLVGGRSSSSALGRADAEALRAQAETLARSRGGSLLVATSPRTPNAAADVLLQHSEVPGVRYRWQAGDPQNPYSLFLAEADEVIVTGDSASMLAEACATGRPVYYAPLPWPARRRRFRALVLELLQKRRRRQGERGTPKQQNRLDRWLDRLLATGMVRLPRDLAALHEALRWSGLARRLGEPQAGIRSAPVDELQRTVRAVRRLLLRGRAVP